MTAEYMHGTPSGGNAIPCRIKRGDLTYPGIVIVVPPTYFRTFILDKGRWQQITNDDTELIWVGEQ